MKSKLTRILALVLTVLLLAGCAPKKAAKTLNGVDISKYTIVYSQDAPDYCQRAAEYIQAQILQRAGVEIPVLTASSGTYSHEILVGDTDRPLSKELNSKSRNMEFYFKADANHIAMNADYFIIAAAAYYFVETYIPGSNFQSTIASDKITVCKPITEKANNFIFLIGDGMGPNQTKLLEEYSIGEKAEDSDNEDIFYGYYLPYQGIVHTDSLSGITDSAAGATALACGYKTINGYVGKDQNGENVQSLTELAISLGKATAVMSTDLMTGATPAGFSAHALDRNHTDDILTCQQKLMLQSETVFECGLKATSAYQDIITDVLETVKTNENGFFLMYEEGYIDKNAHNMDIEETLLSMGRFNQAIGIFMEYAFYHPDTFLIITADHETGGLQLNNEGKLTFTSSSHTGADVPIFGYGQGAEVFQDYAEQNNEIPKVIAALWGAEDFGN